MRTENPKEKESRRKLNSPLLPEMIQWGVSLFATRDHNFQNFSLHVGVCLMPTAERRGSKSLPNKGETPPHPLPHEPPPPPPSEKSSLACCRLELGGSSGRRGREERESQRSNKRLRPPTPCYTRKGNNSSAVSAYNIRAAHSLYRREEELFLLLVSLRPPSLPMWP